MLVVKCDDEGTLNTDDDDGDSAADEKEYIFDETEFGSDDGGEFGDNGDGSDTYNDDDDDEDEANLKCFGMP